MEIRCTGEEIGRIQVRSDQVCAATDDTGWYNTGDLGFMLEGEVFVCGREREVIVHAGVNILPTSPSSPTLTPREGWLGNLSYSL